MTTALSTDATGPAAGAATVRKVLQRFVLPADRDLDVVPLYVDTEPAVLDADNESIRSSRTAKNLNRAALRQSISTGTAPHPDPILDRRRLRVDHSERMSGATYFYRFPASDGRRRAVVEEVTLDISVSGPGATVTVYRSMANGRSQRVDSATTTEEGVNRFEFALSLTPFVD